MDDRFYTFILFGSIADKKIREQLSNAILESLQEKHFSNIGLSNVETDNFSDAISTILSYEIMREMCAKDPSLAVYITQNILDFTNKIKRQILKTESPFENEQQLLKDFKEVEKETFEELWKKIIASINKIYSKDIFDTDFYYKEFKNSFDTNSKEKGKESKKGSFQSVKEHFIEKWEELILRKQTKWELELIDSERKIFCEELYKQIDELKKMQEILEPFTDQLGRLWSMGKGSWKKVNFDILQKYSKILQKDKSLQELAEMMGRMQSAEREYDEEIFNNKIISPEWKTENVSKTNLVGIHESDDISNMLPNEAALLADKTTESLFFQKFTEKKLQTFDFKEDEIQNKKQKLKEEKKGPIIICIDTSGSMHGKPEQVAKTLCFALLKIAVRDNRQCYLISFSTGIETLNLTDFENDLEKLIQFLSMSFGGGTDITEALQESLAMLKTKDFNKADIVAVSDFIMSDIDDEINNQINEAKMNKTKFHSLEIGNSGNREIIEKFDYNWVYDSHDPFSVLVRNIKNV